VTWLRGIQKITLFGKRPSTYYSKNSTNKPIWNLSRTLKVSSSAVQKLSIAMINLTLMRTATGQEDPELPLLETISSLELPAFQIAVQINASEFKYQTHLNINCSEETA
jgi:hypothetical protein